MQMDPPLFPPHQVWIQSVPSAVCSSFLPGNASIPHSSARLQGPPPLPPHSLSGLENQVGLT